MKSQKNVSSQRHETHTLPDAELEVLACLWRKGSATAAEVRRMMKKYRPMAHGSIATLLTRLQEKGLVARSKSYAGKAFLYTPAQTASKGYKSIISNLVDRIFGGKGIMLVTSILETNPPNKEELQQLQKLLDELREKKNKTK
jgi:BlaI family transcriptional regulator, penicillinase repressor